MVFQTAGNKLVYHSEPLTMMDSLRIAENYTRLTRAPTSFFAQALRNSIRTRATPETIEDFSQTIITVHGVSLADVLLLSCGLRLQWQGDRELTMCH